MDLRKIEFLLLTLVVVVILGLIAWATSTIVMSGAHLVIETTPERATAYVDGNFVGTTPLTAKELATGRHVLRLTKFGYAPLLHEVDLRIGRNLLKFNLVELPGGALEVKSTPADAEVFIDGESRGHAPTTVRGLATGGHRVRLSLVNYQDWTNTVDIEEQRTVKLEVTLTTRTEAHYLAAIETDPAAAVLHIDLAHYYITRGEWKKAEDTFVRSLILSTPTNASYGRNSGYRSRLFQEMQKVFTGSFDYDDPARGRSVVVDALMQSLEKCPADLEYHQYAAYWSQADGKLDKAQQAVESGLLHFPSNPDWVLGILRLAYAWNNPADNDQMLKVVEQRVKNNPDDFPSRYQRAVLLKLKGKNDDLVKEHEQLIRLVKSDQLRKRFREELERLSKDRKPEGQ